MPNSKSNDKPKAKKSLSRIIKLDYPIEYGEEGLVSEIELKRPKGKHLKGLTKDVGYNDIIKIASKVSGYPPSFFDEMDAADCTEVSEAIGDFLDNGRGTGRTA